MCVDCDSKKINFLKTNKKQIIVFTDYKNMHIYYKNVKNTQVTRFQKN